jgi:hypothetical protein
MMPTGTDTPVRPVQAARIRAWQIIAAALTVAALAATGVTVWIWLRPPPHPAALTGAAGLHSAAAAQVIRAAPARLVITVDSGALALRAGPAGRVTARQMLTWKNAKPVVTESMAGGTLTITSRCPPGQSACAAALTVSVPPGVAVRAQLASGNILLTGLSGSLQVAADSGDIVGEALTSAQVSARAGAGDVSLAFTAVPAAVTAANAAGDVSIDVPRLTGGYRVRAATKAGDRAVSVGQDPASAHAIVATSDAGDVAVAYSRS